MIEDLKPTVMSIIRNSDEDWSIISSSSDFDERSSNASVTDIKNEFEGVIKNESDSFNDSEVTQLIKDIEQQGSIGSLKLPNLSGSSLRQNSFGSDSGAKIDVKSNLKGGEDQITSKDAEVPEGKVDKSVDKMISFYESLSANTLKLHKSIKEQGENLYTNKLKDLKFEFDSAMFDSVYKSVSNWMLVNSQYLIYFSIIPSSIMIYVLYCRFLVADEPPQDFWNYSVYKSKQVFNDMIYEENTSWFGTKSKKNRLLGFLEYSTLESVNILNAIRSNSKLVLNTLMFRLRSLGEHVNFNGGYYYQVLKSKSDQFWGLSAIYSRTLLQNLKTNGGKYFDYFKHSTPLWVNKVKVDSTKMFEVVKAQSLFLSKVSVQKGNQFYTIMKNNGDSGLKFLKSQGQTFGTYYYKNLKPQGVQLIQLSKYQTKNFLNNSITLATRMVNFNSKNTEVLVSKVSNAFKLYKVRLGQIVNELYTPN